MLKVKELQKQRGLAEVDLFLQSNKPLNEDLKDIWTDEIMEYYVQMSEEIISESNYGHYNDIGGSTGMNDVEEERSGSVDFMTQNEVTNVIDDSLVQMRGGLAAHPSNCQ